MDIKEKLTSLKEEFYKKFEVLQNIEDLENLYREFLSRKGGKISELLKFLPTLSNEEKRIYGKEINNLKEYIHNEINKKIEDIKRKQKEEELNKIDLSLSPRRIWKGSLHPLTHVMEEIKEIFRYLGFQVELGPEVEYEKYNFDALNIPWYHPARDMQDTFYVKEGVVLRTHTSPVQIRTMLKRKNSLPIKMIAPGRVYRNEEISARSYAFFHQLEGLYIDKDVKFSHLKGILEFFLKRLYGENVKVRYRPSYFPFTEPSVEVDISCMLCGGKGCNVCKYTGYLEVLGAGMVHPNVLKAGGIDPDKYSGFAFGLGIERIAMLKYAIEDIRLFYENDIKFLDQF